MRNVYCLTLFLSLWIRVNGNALSDTMYNYLVQNASPLPSVLQNFLEDSLRLDSGGMTTGQTTVQLLMNLLRIMRAQKVLDIGTYGGFSAVAMATALPTNGSVITIDVTDQFWNAVGRRYANQAGVLRKIDGRFGAPAAQVLSKLIDENQSGTFDLCYVDADKWNYKTYFDQCLQLVRPLGILAFDNVLWGGSVVRAKQNAKNEPIVENFLDFNKKLSQDGKVWSQVLAIGDGLALVVKKA